MVSKSLIFDRFYDYDVCLNNYIIELLTKDEPIKKDSEYVNNYLGINTATERNIEQFANCEVFTILKNDMVTFVNEIRKEIEKLPGIESVEIDDSARVGISTYITVKFKLPENVDNSVSDYIESDPQFLTHYYSGTGSGNGMAGEYKLIIRLSTHRPGRKGTKSDININITDKVFNYFKERVLYYVKERLNYINNAWNQYKQTKELPQNQSERNRIRSQAHQHRRAWINELLYDNIKFSIHKSLKESFGGVRLQSIIENEAENILYYLNMNNIRLEDIVSAVEVEFMDEKIIYAELLAILADCLVDNIIEYTFNGGFDYELLFDDMRERIYSK